MEALLLTWRFCRCFWRILDPPSDKNFSSSSQRIIQRFFSKPLANLANFSEFQLILTIFARYLSNFRLSPILYGKIADSRWEMGISIHFSRWASRDLLFFISLKRKYLHHLHKFVQWYYFNHTTSQMGHHDCLVARSISAALTSSRQLILTSELTSECHL